MFTCQKTVPRDVKKIHDGNGNFLHATFKLRVMRSCLATIPSGELGLRVMALHGQIFFESWLNHFHPRITCSELGS